MDFEPQKSEADSGLMGARQIHRDIAAREAAKNCHLSLCFKRLEDKTVKTALHKVEQLIN